MYPKTRIIFTSMAFGFLASTLVQADSVDCPVPDQNRAHAQLTKAEAADKAGNSREAYKLVTADIIGCVKGKANEKRAQAVLSNTSRKLGDEATRGGRHDDAFTYFSRGGHRKEAERAKMNLAKAKSGDVVTVGNVLGFFNDTHRTLSNPQSNEPDRQVRLTAIEGYLKTVRGIVKTNADKAMADEDRAFATRKSAGGGSSLKELERARAWLELSGQERQANERAEKRGDTVMADTARSSLELAINYYHFAHKDAKVKQVKEKARRLGDAHAKKGEKKLAADYYVIAGLDNEAEKLVKAHEAEKEKAEVKRQEKFKKEQKSLEKELGL